MLALKSTKQNYTPSNRVLELLELFRRMVNNCIRIGTTSNVSSLKSLSLKAYHELHHYDVPSYKLCAISRAAGILASRKKSLRRGIPTRSPYAVKKQLVSCYGFKLDANKMVLRISLGRGEFFEILLNAHTQAVLSDPASRVRSFTLTASVLSICISKEVQEIECTKTAGVDRNLRNITYGNDSTIKQYDFKMHEDSGDDKRSCCII